MEFEYTRRQGKGRTYHVAVELMKHAESGRFVYSARVHHGGNYVGPTRSWPLQATTLEAARAEAKSLIERDIEDLVEINE